MREISKGNHHRFVVGGTGHNVARKQTSKRKASKATKPHSKNRRSKSPNKGGRPSTFTPAVGESICKLLIGESGSLPMSLRKICQRKDMPGITTVFEWLERHQTFADQYARARSIQADVLADETVSIADAEKDPAKARIRIDARKWFAGKVAPKKYGDHMHLSHGGTEGAPPIPVRQDVSVSGTVKLEASDAYLKLITGSKR